MEKVINSYSKKYPEIMRKVKKYHDKITERHGAFYLSSHESLIKATKKALRLKRCKDYEL